MKWTAQRNRVAALAARLPGPHLAQKFSSCPDLRLRTAAYDDYPTKAPGSLTLDWSRSR